MEGAPGHQAATLSPDGSVKRDADGRPAGNRGAYGNDNARTFGGFDQMTAIVGGLWDSLLAEGRRFWIVATSDSHANFADPVSPGSDFWPGQYQKTYVYAQPTYDDVLDGLRSGRIFVVSGDLVSELDVEASSGAASAGIGGILRVRAGSDVSLTVRFRDPETANANGETPRVARVDLISGPIAGLRGDRNADRNDTTRVIRRFDRSGFRSVGEVHTLTTTLAAVQTGTYVRIRGTNTAEMEPSMDNAGENPWTDLWFYSNPIFVEVW